MPLRLPMHSGVPELLRRIWVALRRRIRGGPNPVIWNANGADERRCRQSALLVYLPRAFQLPPGDPAFLRHANIVHQGQRRSISSDTGKALTIPSSLGEKIKGQRWH